VAKKNCIHTVVQFDITNANFELFSRIANGPEWQLQMKKVSKLIFWKRLYRLKAQLHAVVLKQSTHTVLTLSIKLSLLLYAVIFGFYLNSSTKKTEVQGNKIAFESKADPRFGLLLPRSWLHDRHIKLQTWPEISENTYSNMPEMNFLG